jgi:hypothetical protein
VHFKNNLHITSYTRNTKYHATHRYNGNGKIHKKKSIIKTGITRNNKGLQLLQMLTATQKGEITQKDQPIRRENPRKYTVNNATIMTAHISEPNHSYTTTNKSSRAKYQPTASPEDLTYCHNQNRGAHDSIFTPVALDFYLRLLTF